MTFTQCTNCRGATTTGCWLCNPATNQRPVSYTKPCKHIYREVNGQNWLKCIECGQILNLNE